SPNKPTIPQEKIRSLTSLDHPQSPFYDPEGGAIAPVARVVVERITRKGEQCNVVPDTIDDIVADIGQEEKEEDDTPQTCIYSPWSPWSACSSATCDKGRRMRQRMLKAQLDLSVPCPHTQDFQPCMAPGCSMEEPSTCMMSEWISWSACSVSCGMGMRSRERYVKQYPEDGSLCQLQTEETEKCVVNDECSDSSCVVTEWGEWDPCSVTCGVGMRRRERMVKMPPIDGSMCKTEVAEVEKCMMPECHTIPCMLSPWSDWSECSVTCGRGVRNRQRMLKSDPTECTEELEQTEKCMLPECPMDCMVSEWSEWSECNKSCGKGHTIRTRMIKLEPQFGGSSCPETIQRKKCKIRKCRTKGGGGSKAKASGAVGCRLQPWTSWTDCTISCGGGLQQRLRVAKKRVKGICKDRREIRACNNEPCYY
ncbi:Spondin-1, partial [Characodon lateralis]|nr:Spondin-1 [Characodon lateralis]